MATVSVNVPDALVPDLLAAVRSQYPQYADVPPRELAQRVLADHLRSIYLAHRERQATVQAMAAVQGSVQDARTRAAADAGGIA